MKKNVIDLLVGSCYYRNIWDKVGLKFEVIETKETEKENRRTVLVRSEYGVNTYDYEELKTDISSHPDHYFSTRREAIEYDKNKKQKLIDSHLSDFGDTKESFLEELVLVAIGLCHAEEYSDYEMEQAIKLKAEELGIKTE